MAGWGIGEKRWRLPQQMSVPMYCIVFLQERDILKVERGNDGCPRDWRMRKGIIGSFVLLEG
jgi:hypothetical protein